MTRISPCIEGLQQKITNKYPQLHQAIIIKDPPGKNSDFLHKTLGHTLAYFIHSFNGFMINEDDVIGIGSGRGPYHTAKGLKILTSREKFKQQNVTAASLTASITSYAKKKEGDPMLRSDANDIVFILSGCFSGNTSQKTVGYPISPTVATASRDDTWLNKKEFKAYLPKYAIVGVGVLSEKHRYIYEALAYEKKVNTIHRAINQKQVQKDLITLYNLVKGMEQCPVADMCNRLFFVDSLESSIKDKKTVTAIKELIDTINSQLLTINWDQLKQIQKIILVGGSPKKARAIKQILEENKFKAHILCTDENTAKLLL